MLRIFLKTLLKRLYRIEVQGIENFSNAGERVVIVANHLSFLDALLLALFLPEKPLFAINSHIAQIPWLKPFLKLGDTLALNPQNPMAAKALIERIRENRKCVIFPEGRITVTGSLMKIYEGPGMIADKAGACILPVRIDGAQYTPFSRLHGKSRIRWFPKITLFIMKPRHFEVDPSLKGRKRRESTGRQLYDVMTEMLFDSSPWRRTLYQSVMDAFYTHGGDHIVAEDIQRKPITYRMLIAKSLILGRKLKPISAQGDFIGLLLPNMVATLVSFLGLHAFGRIPVMLNFSAGAHQVRIACETIQLKHAITSRKFIETAKLQAVESALIQAGIQLYYLEDIARKVRIADKLAGIACAYFPALWKKRLKTISQPTDPAVILFTSGSEGTPKAVLLSHENLLANRYQMSAKLDFGSKDIIFNALPMFHSFGLTGGMILPLTSGVKIFFYPSPLHYRIIPELVYDTNSTILFGTDTFLSGYAKYAHPYDFYAIRYIFAGAERLKEETRRLWQEKYGVRIFEGYGTTETAPVIAANTPMQSRAGTVGRLMPKVETRLEAVEGVAEGGRLWVRGPNVMLGYMHHNAPGKLDAPESNWYDTGDIVAFDEQGFMTILGRAKRFAKIGGEMVSLAAVEHYASLIWPNANHAALSVPDPRKGEQIILLTEHPHARREDFIDYYKENGIHELSLPKIIKQVEKIPLLGNGKIDYLSAKQLLEASS